MDEKLVAQLVRAFQDKRPRGPFLDEGDFERRFVEPVCRAVLGEDCLYVHPWGDEAKAARWHGSKGWGAVRAGATVHAFDLLARKKGSKKSLAVEVKFARKPNGRLPPGDFQRMLGQCLLARYKHEFVIGLFGHTGDLQYRSDDETQALTDKLAKRHNIWVVVKKVG